MVSCCCCLFSYLNILTLFARYLVDQRWLEQWKKFVGFDSRDLRSAAKQEAHPGPVDNAKLLKCTVQSFTTSTVPTKHIQLHKVIS